MAAGFDPARFTEGPIAMPQSAKVVQRLLAHAKLCREIASASWNQTSAEKLEEMAAECERSAAGNGETTPTGTLH